jgi:flagellar transcriptional activator FlhD
MNQRDETIDSIHALNLAWLRLARLMARQDEQSAATNLGVTAEVVELLAKSTDSRLAELAAIPQLLCAFRFESQFVLTNLAPDAARVIASAP